MQNKKALAATALSAMMVLSFAGCSQNSADESPISSSSSSSPASSSSASAQTPVEVTTIKMLDPSVTFAQGEDIEHNIWTRAAQDEYGITVKYKWTAPSDQYNEKVALMLATGDLPDFLQLDASGYEQAQKAGLLADLTEVYDKYASPALKERMQLDGGDALQAGQVDGKLYAIVQANSWRTDSEQMLYVRQDWLDRLHLQAPKTIDDVMNVARAFAQDDPDGDGSADTLGIGINLQNYRGFLNGNDAYKSIWMPDASGGLVYSSIQPEMKNALLKLQTMYKDGLIDKEFYAKGADAFKQDITSGKIGMLYENYVEPLTLMESWAADKNADWKVYPQPSLDLASYPAKSEVRNGFSYYLVASKNMKHPEALIELLNLFVDKQSNDADFITDKDGRMVHEYSPVNISVPDNNLYNQRLIAAAIQQNDPSGLPAQAKQNYDSVVRMQQGSEDKTDWGLGHIFAPDSTLSVLDQNYFTPEHYVKDQWYGAPTPSMIKYQATLNDLEDQVFTKIIKGDSIDEFDQFVAQWKSSGGDQITQEVNEAYRERSRNS